MGLHLCTRLMYRRNSHRAQGGPIARVNDVKTEWIVRECWRETVLNKEAPDWFQLETEPRAECVAVGKQRVVWRVECGGRFFFAKVVHEGGFLNRAKAWLLGTHAEREWRTMTVASAAGVSLPGIVGVGISSEGTKDGVLLTEALPNATTLGEAWKRDVPPVDDRRRRSAVFQLIDSVARLFATSHQNGFIHRDGHPNNILIVPNKGDGPRAAFVDTLGSRLLRRSVPERLAVHSLAHLDQYFHRLMTRTERLRFLKAYGAGLPEKRKDPLCDGEGKENPCRSVQTRSFAIHRRFLAKVMVARSHHAVRLAAQWDRRFRRPGKYFSRIELGEGWTATVVTRLERRHVFPEAHVPDRTAAQWRELLARITYEASGSESITCQAAGGQIRSQRVIVRGLIERIRSTLVASSHQQMFEKCHRRRHRDLPAELVLGYAEHRTAGLIDETMLFVPGTSAEQNVR